MVATGGRTTGYGIFVRSFSDFWFLESELLRVFYSIRAFAVIVASVAAQLVLTALYISPNTLTSAAFTRNNPIITAISADSHFYVLP